MLYNYLQMTVEVTGAAGHAGSNLLRVLLSQGRPTRALVHIDRRAIDGLGIEAIEGNIYALKDKTLLSLITVRCHAIL